MLIFVSGILDQYWCRWQYWCQCIAMVVQEAADVLHWQAGGLKVEKGRKMGWPLEGMMVTFRGRDVGPRS